MNYLFTRVFILNLLKLFILLDLRKSFRFLVASNLIRSNPRLVGNLFRFAQKKNFWDEELISIYVDLCLKRSDRTSALQALLQQYEFSSSEALNAAILNLIGVVTPVKTINYAMDRFFDAEFYTDTNPDVLKSGVDARVHYLVHGWREGRLPSSGIGLRSYLRSARNKLPANEFPLAHYEGFGRRSSDVAGSPPEGEWFQIEPLSYDQWEKLSPTATTDTADAVVVIPVYKGRTETLRAIYNAVYWRGDQNYAVHVINDRSPDNDLNTELNQIAELGLFKYFVNGDNLGFTRSVNAALTHIPSGTDIVLLNADAFVFNNWFERLRFHAYSSGDVATVTPLSNNATLCSYPSRDMPNRQPQEIQIEELDRLAAQHNARASVDIPTGVGFCMYIRSTAVEGLEQLFDDENFPMGYGEENDFCIGARKRGFRNLLACDVLVYHVGSVSFAETRSPLSAQGMRRLLVKHPDYTRMISAHYHADPVRPYRRSLDVARLEALGVTTVWVTHRWTGGIDRYLQERRKQAAEERSITLSVHDNYYVTAEIDDCSMDLPNLHSIDLRTESAIISSILGLASVELVSFNSAAGLDWYCHKRLLTLISSSETPYEYIVHDYSSVSHNYLLLRPDGVYCGRPSIKQLNEWNLLDDISRSVDRVDFPERNLVYQDFLTKADRIIAPSFTAKANIEYYFRDLNIEVLPHDNSVLDVPHLSQPRGGNDVKIAVVGAIGKHKGSDILSALSARSQTLNLPVSIHVVGYTDDDTFATQCGVHISGRYYHHSEMVKILRDIDPDFIFIPSICEETFCYVLSDAFSEKIPPLVFDLGAQAERVRQAGFGHIVPLKYIADTDGLAHYILGLGRRSENMDFPAR